MGDGWKGGVIFGKKFGAAPLAHFYGFKVLEALGRLPSSGFPQSGLTLLENLFGEEGRSPSLYVLVWWIPLGGEGLDFSGKNFRWPSAVVWVLSFF